MQRVIVLNGSIRGADGNTASLLRHAVRCLPETAVADEVVLADYAGSVEGLAELLTRADALLFGSGVYWGSWGSPLQRFLEIMTAFEASECFLGKPAGAVITMDSVGGTDVAQRLLGVLSTLGCVVPPMAMVVVSRIGTLVEDRVGNEDVWQTDDVKALMANLVTAMDLRTRTWSAWPYLPVERTLGAYPASGRLVHGLERFLQDPIAPAAAPLRPTAPLIPPGRQRRAGRRRLAPRVG